MSITVNVVCKNKQSGFSLIELLLVLGVLAILLLAAFVVYPQVRRQNIVNEQLYAVRAMVEGVRGIYGNRPYDSVTGEMVRNSGMIPRTFHHPTNPILMVNHWGGTMTLQPWGEDDTSSTSDTYKSRMRLSYTNFPQEYCVPMATGFMGFADKLYIAPAGGGATITPPNELTELDVNRIIDLCSRPATGDRYGLMLYFR